MNTSDVVLGSSSAGTRPAAVARPGALVSLFSGTLFTSAFLLFLVQPMIAKMVLPVLGGAPMVWNTCVVFFQMALLAGYGYAYGVSRHLRGGMQIALHLAVLAVPLSLLPFTIDSGALAPPAESPIVWLLMLLGVTIGLPFFALSTTASVLQHWFSKTDDPRAHDPYFLYAASNGGSLLALVAYPAVVEPFLTLGGQGRFWAAGYAVFVALAALCGVATWRTSAVPTSRTVPESRADNALTVAVTPLRRARWVLLAFIPSSLMLAVTTYLSTDIAAVPLFWVLPLGIYLLTFIAAFGTQRARALTVATRFAPLLIVPLAMCMSTGVLIPASVLFLMHLFAFAAIAMVCHGRLAVDRPHAAALTEFYFWLSFGGMLGGLFNGLAAPLLFDRVLEYPLVLAFACLWLPAAAAHQPRTGRRRAAPLIAPVAVGLVALAILEWASARNLSGQPLLALFGLPGVFAFAQRRDPLRFGASVAALLLAGWAAGVGTHNLHAERTFFGVYRVMNDSTGRYHELVHGTTLHGVQATDRASAGEPLSYFHRTGPVGQMFAHLPAAAGAQVGVIGLGIGSIASYARDGQRFTFYEIDPAVERIARTAAWFTHLDRCGPRCTVVLGDARLSLAAAPPGGLDFLILDAFSSDAIPMHLLTREAVALYLSRLAPGGAIAFHISNRHLSLSPVIGGIARSHDLVALQQFDRSTQGIERKQASHWIVAAKTFVDLGPIASDERWKPLTIDASAPVWTDDFSNILQVWNLR